MPTSISPPPAERAAPAAPPEAAAPAERGVAPGAPAPAGPAAPPPRAATAAERSLLGDDADGAPPLASARLVPSSAGPRRVLRRVGVLALLSLLAAFLPWQQSVRGRGEVTTLRPGDRPQAAPAVVGGRIAEWYVQEGQYVTKGTPLVRLEETSDAYLDPATPQRYAEQERARDAALAAKREQVAALGAQLTALEQGRVLALDQARNTIVRHEAAVAAAEADSAVAQDQLARRERLHADGLASLNDLQGYRLRWQRAAATLTEARNALANARLQLPVLEASYADQLARVRASRSTTLADVADGEGQLAALRNARASFGVRQSLYVVTAPQDGYVVQTLRAGVGEQVSAGEPVLTVMPDAPELAATLYVPATDVPLLAPGRKVRLQFDGWPALQFSGWPSVAVGTFGGEIAVVDLVSAPDGRYRVLVRPDPDDEPWPAQLRQGSGVLGWAMLDEVTLGFELWRRLNGFPPVVQAPGGAPAGAPAPAPVAK